MYIAETSRSDLTIHGSQRNFEWELRMNRIQCHLIVLTCLAVGATGALGQRNPGKDDVPTVVVLGTQGQGTPVRPTIYLRPGWSPEAVIAVSRSGITENELADAFRALVAMRRRYKQMPANYPDGATFRMTLSRPKSTRKLTSDEHRAYGGYIASF